MPIPRPPLPRRAMTVGAAVIAVLAVAALAFVVLPQDSSADTSTRDARITLPESPESTGTVDIDARLYAPAVTPAPTVLLAHGFGGSKDSVDGEARDLAARGYTVLAYSARGFGDSTGSISINDPDREVADARGLIDWLAEQPEVELDAPGDPHVGVAGGSYGGALALSAGGTDPRIDSIAAAITWNDLGQALFPNYGVTSTEGREALGDKVTPAAAEYGGPGVLKRGWAGVFFGAGAASTPPGDGGDGGDASTETSGTGDGASACGRFSPEFCDAYAQSAVTGIPSQQLLDLLTAHSPVAVASNITAPTLLVQGTQDTLFGLDQADATARQIAAAGGNVTVRWFDGGHDAGGTDGTSDRAIADFFDRTLRDREAATGSQPFVYSTQRAADERGGDRNRRMTAPDYPGLAADSDATQTESVTFTPRAENQSIIRPPGASPSAISSVPGLGSVLSTLGSTGAGAALTADLPGQSATFTSDPVDSSVTITGAPRVNLRVASLASPGQAVLFAKLYDVAPNGTRTLPGGAVSAIRLPDTEGIDPVDVTVALPGISYAVQQGHRLELSISTTDQAYAVPLEPAQFSVAMTDNTIALPTVPAEESANSTVPVAPLIGIGVVLLAVAGAIVAGAVRTRRRAVAEVDESLIDTPLVITDLAKTYSNSFRAVDGVSFEVKQGQVLGLLGPNGAGKTTTLRMLMGLITPTGGDIRVFGHKVTPGAPVLSRLGSFVEGSGFLPHLTGTQNLRLYWEATGRPIEDAHLEEALEIADLGTAIERKVKSYSQGMRQRLAIAQAMLGLPDLMVLDEPTNGLDPPQIRTMRDVLINYAKTGRTVLVSSHLLAEVEQTCTHVVVMNRGSVISSGTVRELTAAGGQTEIRVDDATRARSVLDASGHDGAVIVDDGTVTVDLTDADSAVVIRELVTAGVSVRGFSQSTRLEDVFLDLVHRDTPGSVIHEPDTSKDRS
ncbi:alpha/beta fold hydrolase [Rhodococcus sp. IEGM 1381]|uniref:alpha/beta fold hydrolase n=1 Tax=Rhodococcus sp. IEGM 1381 TaxID=3047085 RepID=UPI0024B85015|nr:alpha/beta fold hydrolase [Rhodococcus sp. IEGM 1381]MDI9896708.1 alpha/beta fold hydrolase [Rhodococcus sp. IEGM 1381]